MSDIDYDKLEQALRAVVSGTANLESACGDMVIEAARAHLATLPGWKNVEMVRWTLVSPSGRCGAANYDDERQARCVCPSGWSVVRLTGTRRVRA